MVGSVADACRARTPVVAHPMHRRALARQAVAIGLALHPARPLLAQLIARHPPFAAVLCAVAVRETCRHGAHLARHAPVGGIADGQLKTRDVEKHGLAADGVALRRRKESQARHEPPSPTARAPWRQPAFRLSSASPLSFELTLETAIGSVKRG